MRVQLFGIGTLSKSPAITAQSRVNVYVDVRKEADRTQYAACGRFGLDPFVSSLGLSPSRGMWAVNTLASGPLLFSVNGNTLYSINNAAVTSVIGVLGSVSGDVSMADDGTFLVIVDGARGYVYNMAAPAGLVQITDPNFTSSPSTVTWQDDYFIVTSNTTRQFQLSQITPSIDPTVWPAIQINFAGSGAAPLRAGMADHSILNLFSDVYTEFWQDTGSPDFPYAKIPGTAQQFGLAAPWSLAKFDNSMAGLFQSTMGGVNVSRMAGFSLRKISDQDMDQILSSYAVNSNAEGFAFTIDGHPMYVIVFPSAGKSWMFDGLSNIWTELQSANGSQFIGVKFANFENRLLVSDRMTGNIYQLNPNTYSDNGASIPVELVTKHIYNENKYIGISQVQVEFEAGVGLVSGQGSDPVIDLQVSKDGGRTFFSVGYSSMGAIGDFTQRIIWNTLGAARDWVLKLRISDPVKVILTGASCEMQGGPF